MKRISALHKHHTMSDAPLPPNSLVSWYSSNGTCRIALTARDGTVLEFARFQNGVKSIEPRSYLTYKHWADTLLPGYISTSSADSPSIEIFNLLSAVPRGISDYDRLQLIHSLFGIGTRVTTIPSPYDQFNTAADHTLAARNELKALRNPTAAEKYHLGRIIRSRQELQQIRYRAFTDAEPSKRYLPRFSVHTYDEKRVVGVKDGVEKPLALHEGRILFNGTLANTFGDHVLDTYATGKPVVSVIYRGERSLVNVWDGP